MPGVVRQSEAPDTTAAVRLKINEIFCSLQGEARTVGVPTVFIRLTGCPLRCQYCDTAYAFHAGDWMALPDILEQVAGYGARYVTVSGGEPLAQKGCALLLDALCEAGYEVSLETSGAMDIGGLDRRVSRVLDIKTPGSGESARNLWRNIEHLTSHDQVKFVICDRADYDWACEAVREHDLAAHCEVLFSPSHEQLEARQLADWVVADALPVRFQIQLHKYLWGDVPGR